MCFNALGVNTLTIPLGCECASSRVGCYLKLSRTSILIFNPRFVNEIRRVYSVVPGIGRLFCTNQSYPDFTRDCSGLIACYSSGTPRVSLAPRSGTTVCFSSNAANFPGTVLRGRRDLIRTYGARRGRRKRAGRSIFLYVPPLCRANTGVR